MRQLFVDECNCIIDIGNAWNASRESSSIVPIYLGPGVMVFGICHKVTVFHFLTSLIVEHTTHSMSIGCMSIGNMVLLLEGLCEVVVVI